MTGMRSIRGVRALRALRGLRFGRGVRDVRPEESEGRGLMLESEHYGNWILEILLEVWLEATRLVYCSVSREI